LFLATRKAWEARRHARTQTAMKLSAARANVSGKVVTKYMKTSPLAASDLALILVTENVSMNA
jgi:hypothetical protein